MAPLVALGELDRVPQGVAVVEDLPQPLLGEVVGHDARLDPHRALDQLGQHRPGRVGRVGALPLAHLVRLRLDQLEDALVGDETRLDDLRHPRHEVPPVQGLERSQVAQHPRRRVEGTHEVLALGGVDAGLATHRGVDHGQQRRRQVHDLQATQPGGRDEPGQIRRRTATHGHDRVGPGEVRLPEHLPAEGGDLRRLLLLGVGELDGERLVPLGHEVLADRLARRGQRRRVHHQHPPYLAAEHPGQLTEQVPPDDDVVRGVPVHGHADRHASTSCATSFATWCGSRSSETTCTVASRS